MHISKNAKIIIAGLLAIIVACGIGFSDNIFKSNAAAQLKELTTLKNTEKITKDTTIPAEYTFYPDIQKSTDGTQITKVTPFGEWDYTNTDTVSDETGEPIKGIANIVWINKDDHSYDGKIGMKYDNVGSYNGHTISLKVTYMGSSENSTTNGFGLIMYNDSLGIRTSAAPYSTIIKYEFLDAETGKPISVKGYQSFEDIDAYQGLKISNYDKIYYSEGALSNLKVANYGGNLNDLIQSTISDIHDDPDNTAKLSYTFTGSELTYTWTTSLCYYKNNEPTKEFSIARCYKGLDKEASIAQALSTFYYVDKNGNLCDSTTEGATARYAILTLDANSKKVIPSETKVPLKSISDSKGDSIAVDTYKRTDKIYFSVIHEVPGEISTNYYKSYAFLDRLSTPFTTTRNDVKIYNDATKKDVSDKFEITVDNTSDIVSITANAKESTLKSSDFYATAYNMVIGVTIKDGYDLTDYYTNGTYSIPNIGEVFVNGKNNKSNQVNVKIVDDPTLFIEKNVDNDTYTVGDTANYTVKVTQLIQNTIAKNVVITDTLDNENATIITNSIKIKDKNGNDLKSAQITSNKNTYTIKTNADLAKDEFFIVSYSVNLDNENLKNKTVNNTVIANADNVSNVVASARINVLPAVEYIPILTIDKKADKMNCNIGDKIKYTIKVSQTEERAIAKNVVITDTFDTSLIKPENIKITDKNGNELKNVKITTNEKGFILNTNSDLAKDEFFTVTYDAKLSDKNLTGTSINNIATSYGDNTTEVKDTEKITVLKPVLTINKKVSKSTVSLGDKVTYTLKVSQTVKDAIAKNVVITDTFNSSLVKPENIKITNKDGNTVNNAIIETNEKGFAIKTNSDLAKDEFFTVTYDAKLSDKNLTGTLNNTATTKADNTESVEDDVNVSITTPNLTIEKKVSETTVSLGDKVTYTLKVSQTAKDAIAKNVVITDTFDSSLVKPENIKITDKNGNTVNNATIETNEKGFTIKTNSDLAKDEFFTVSYDAKLSNDKLVDTTVNNIATTKADNTNEVKDNAKITIIKPVLSIKKTVSKTNVFLDDIITYTIKVTQTEENAVAKNIVITDNFDTSLLKIENLKLTDKNGNEIKDFTYTMSTDNSDKNTGLIIDTKTNLSKDEYIIVTYTVNLTNKNLMGTSVNNIAKAKGSNTDEVKDNVKITMPKPELKIKKSVSKTNYSLGDKVTYTIKVSQTVNDAIAKNVVITDTFDSSLVKPENIKITNKDGNEVKNAEIIMNENEFTINTNSNLTQDEYFTVVYTITLTDKTLSNTSVNNLAKAKSDTTDEVKDNVKINILEPKLAIKKDVNKEIFSTNEKAKYTIKVSQTVKDAIAKNVIITDTFDTSLVKPENIKITDKNGNTVNTADIEIKENGFTINTNSNLAQDEFFTITYDVIYSNSELSGKSVINKAIAGSDNTKDVEDSKTVTITKPELTIEKKSDKTIYSTGETAKYTLIVKQIKENAVAKNIVIKDVFDNENISKPTNVKITDNKGNNVNSAEVLIDERGFVINTNSNLAQDEFFTITYNVNMSNALLSGKDIINNATAKAENTELVKTNNTVSVTTPKLSIEKKSNKTAYSSSETAKYTLKITQTEENAVAKNVVINDTFDNKNITKPSNIKITDNKGNDVSTADITISDTGFIINTNADLKKDEFFTVEYTVNLSNSLLTGATVKNIATTKADNAEQVEDTVSITIGKPDLSVIKTSNKDSYGTDENANYTVKVTQTVKDATAQNIVLTDVFDKQDANVILNTIKIKDKDGNDIQNAEISKNGNGYIIKTHTNLNYNESITITYTANFVNDNLSGENIKNTVSVKSDNTPEKKVEKTVKVLAPVLKIEKSSDQAAYLLGSTAKYTVKITQTQKDTIAKKVKIVDELSNKKAKIIKDSLKILDSKGNAISGVEIVTTDNIYQIKTNKDLVYNEQLIITYDVEFKDSSLNNTDVINTVQVTGSNVPVINAKHTVKISNNKTVVDKVNTDAKVQTGNDLPITLFMILGILSIAGIGTAITLKEKK